MRKILVRIRIFLNAILDKARQVEAANDQPDVWTDLRARKQPVDGKDSKQWETFSLVKVKKKWSNYQRKIRKM
jgi:hypothetical protein